MQYEEKEITLARGESVLLYSDGLVEAHNAEREMFGFPRLIALLSLYQGEESAIDFLRDKLAAFTGESWEQEDDITLVTLRRMPVPGGAKGLADPSPGSEHTITDKTGTWKVLGTRQIPSEIGNERLAMSYVATVLTSFNLPARRIDQLGTAVAEATMNAMEHGNHYDPELPVTLQVLSSGSAIAVRISDQGGNGQLPTQGEYEVPDIAAKLSEQQSPRGWGLFLIQNMVDEMHILSDEKTHTIELIVHLEGESHVHQNA